MNNSLNGMKILVTRAEHQAGELTNLIKQLGGCPIHLPLQKVVQCAINDLELKKLVIESEWILFTSVNSVQYFVQNSTKELIELINLKKIGAVGEKTKKSLEKHQLKVSFIPSEFTGKTFANELSKNVNAGTKFLFIRGSLASDTVPNILQKNGHIVSSLTVYETIPNESVKDQLIDLVKNGNVDLITFLNPFSVRQFCFLINNSFKVKDLKFIKIACIGEVTALEASRAGFEKIIVPGKYTIEALLHKIAEEVKFNKNLDSQSL